MLRKKCFFLIAALIGTCLTLGMGSAGAAWATEITVTGTSTYPADHEAVQAAVDTYDIVTLVGTFDFGSAGGVRITRPNVTLQGPATILGGGKQVEHPDMSWFWYAIEVSAPGVKVLDLDLTIDNTYITAVLLYVTEPGNGAIEIKGNTITNSWAGVASVGNVPCPVVIRNNFLENVAEIAYMFEISSTLDIIENELRNGWGDGMWIAAWSAAGMTDPEGGENEPVRIIGNTIDMNSTEGFGIAIGTSAHGINNCLVKDNTITGTVGYGGLVKYAYGHNNSFIKNDLSGLETYSPQLWLQGGRDNRFLNNKLGTVVPGPWLTGDFGSVFERAPAALSCTINWHLNDWWLQTPDPVNERNLFASNDYSQTGLPGWIDGGSGCVLLLNFVQKYYPDPDRVPYEELFASENTVAELVKFPAGTNVCTQVMDESFLQGDELVEGTNQIAGWGACEAHARKADFQRVSDEYKNFGQYLKSMREAREAAMEKLHTR